MDPRLTAAAEAGDIDALYALIQEDASPLEIIDKVLFVDNPLHIAASRGCTDFAMEMVTLMPSYARKLNQHGFSPMHLALLNENNDLVLRLVDHDNNLIRVKGRNGMTPLHYAAKLGNLLALAKFLLSCPECIKDVTIQGETALHIALKENKKEAFRVLVGWIRRTTHKDARDFEDKILNWRDNGDDSVLHIAARNGQAEEVKLLLRSRLVDVHTENKEKLTALNIAKQSDNMEIKKMFRLRAMLPFRIGKTFEVTNHLMSNITLREKIKIRFTRLIENISSETRDSLLVVFALVATANYEAVISPPGGLWQGQRDTNSPIPGIFQHVVDTQYTTKSSAAALPPASLGKVIMDAQSSSVIWTLNTINLLMNFILILYLFPSGLRRLLSIPLVIMYICYALSMSIISATPEDGYLVLVTAPYFMAWIWASINTTRNRKVPREWGSSNII